MGRNQGLPRLLHLHLRDYLNAIIGLTRVLRRPSAQCWVTRIDPCLTSTARGLGKTDGAFGRHVSSKKYAADKTPACTSWRT